MYVNLPLSKLVAVSLNQVGDAGLPLLAANLPKETSWASSLLDKTVEGPGLPLGAWASKCCFKVSFDIPSILAAQYTDVPCHTILLAFSMASAVYFFFSLPIFIPDLNSLTFVYLLYPQTKVGDILDSGPLRRRRRNFLVDAITQKRINIFFSNLVHMLRMPKGRSLF